MCSRQPCFAPEGEKLGKFCSEHKASTDVDVRHPRCEFVEEGLLGREACPKLSCFGVAGQRQRFCFRHKVCLGVSACWRLALSAYARWRRGGGGGGTSGVLAVVLGYDGVLVVVVVVVVLALMLASVLVCWRRTVRVGSPCCYCWRWLGWFRWL